MVQKSEREWRVRFAPDEWTYARILNELESEGWKIFSTFGFELRLYVIAYKETLKDGPLLGD